MLLPQRLQYKDGHIKISASLSNVHVFGRDARKPSVQRSVLLFSDCRTKSGRLSVSLEIGTLTVEDEYLPLDYRSNMSFLCTTEEFNLILQPSNVQRPFLYFSLTTSHLICSQRKKRQQNANTHIHTLINVEVKNVYIDVL